MPVWNCSSAILYEGLRSLERPQRHRDRFVEGEQREVLVGDLRNEQDLEGLVGLCAREVLLQRLVAQALHAPEEVDFPGGRQPDGVRVKHACPARGRGARRSARCGRVGECADLRQQRGTLDRYCACIWTTFNAAMRRSRLLTRAISTRRCSRGSVRKSRHPISTAGNVAALPGRQLVSHPGRIARGNRCRGPLVHRLQRAPGEQAGESDEERARHGEARVLPASSAAGEAGCAAPLALNSLPVTA